MKKQILILLFLAFGELFAFAQNQGVDTNKARIDALLQEMHDAATWGAPTTNGIQLGVALFNGNGIKPFRVYTYLYDETNFWVGHYPPSGYRLNLSLKDANGNLVEKTKEGCRISKPIGFIVKTKIGMRKGADLVPQKNPQRYESPFNLLDCFKVEIPGTNMLTVGATVFKRDNNGDIYEVALPPVSIQIPITQSDIDNYRASKNNTK